MRRGGSHGGGDITREQLDELKTKFQLLEGDRKAYFETYETTKRTNEQLFRELRAKNRELRQALANVQREQGGAGAGQDDEITRVSSELNSKRTQFDQLKHKVKKLTEDLDLKRDQFKELELEAAKVNDEDSPLTRKIRLLENRLDKAMIKYNEAQSIRKTYEQIVKRLKEERVGFDNQLAALERTLNAKKHDYEELLLLSGDANHAKEMAIVELERVKQLAKMDHERRVKELREKEGIVQNKLDMKEKAKQREQLRRDIIAEAAGDLGADEEEKLKSSLALNRMQSSQIAEESAAQRKKIDVYEEAFRKIKEATGVSDVNEVIQKIVSQEDQQNNLMQLTAENTAKIEKMNEEAQALKGRVEQLKYSAPNTRTGARKMVDNYEERLTEATTRLDRAKDKYERLAKILINVKAGIDHLTEKLETVREDGQQLSMSDETIVDVLYQCETTLMSLLGRIKANQSSRRRAEEGGAGAVMGLGLSETDIVASRPNNTRIEIVPDGAVQKADSDSDDDDHLDTQDDDAMTRDKVKRAALLHLSLQKKKDKKAKRAMRQRPTDGSGMRRSRRR